MRRLLVAGFIAVAAQSAYAADLPDVPILRGSFRDAPVVSRTVWQGFYVGGQAGYGSSTMAFEDLNQTGWPSLPGTTHRATIFGAFGGYNAQFEDVVIGLDASYMHGTFSGDSSNQSTVIGTPLTVTRTSTGAMSVKDFGSLRVRGGYAIGNFLPYAFAGVGLGRADTSRSIGIQGFFDAAGLIPAGPPTILRTDTKNQFVHGVSAGVGVDMMLFGGVFLRAEYEYLQFTSTIPTNIHSVRGGLGYKF
jgi:opacity protein-like surface antigen